MLGAPAKVNNCFELLFLHQLSQRVQPHALDRLQHLRFVLADFIAFITPEAVEYVSDIAGEKVHIVAVDGSAVRGPVPELLDLIKSVL